LRLEAEEFRGEYSGDCKTNFWQQKSPAEPGFFVVVSFGIL
jgi:hypothetical protein